MSRDCEFRVTDYEYDRQLDGRTVGICGTTGEVRALDSSYEKGLIRGVEESDPFGKTPGSPGSKLDAGKVDVTRGCLHYFPRALSAIAELSAIGAKKYSWKGWESVPDGINRYSAALGRHELKIEGDYSRRDGDTGVLEATAVAWNALARLELILRGGK